MNSFDSFFHPGSVAIVGASVDPDSINGRPLRFLVEKGYTGKVYPINPKYETLMGQKCYPDISLLPEVPDLAIIVVNAKVALKVISDCKRLGVKNAIVFSSGFAEADNKELQAELDALVAMDGTRICGPNCQGMANLFDHTLATFSAAVDHKELVVGPAAFLSQSGALGFSTFDMGQERRVGFGYVVTTGNQCDIDVSELAEYIISDERINVVICYLEGVKDVSRLRRAALAAREARKPLCVLKVGKSSAGEKAAKSHTAALTGSALVFDAFARQENVVLLNDITEVIDAAAVFSPGKRAAGRRIGILTSSGGAGILMADRCEELGLEVPELSHESRETIKKYIPAFGSARNPVDLTAQVVNDAAQFRACLDVMVAEPDIDVIVVIMTMIVGESAEQVVRDVIEVGRNTVKPIAVCWTVATDRWPYGHKLASAGIPTFISPAACAKSIANLVDWSLRDAEMRAIPASERKPLSTAKRDALCSLAELGKSGKPLTEYAAKQALAAWGVPVTLERVVRSADEAVQAAREIGFPVAAKVSSVDIPHKTEAKAVKVGLKTEEDVRTAFTEIMANSLAFAPAADIEGVLIQEMVSGGTEVIVGVTHDAQFGPTMMFGLGGIFVEVLKDVTFRVAPIDIDEARRMVGDIRARKVLEGVRGRPKADVEALAGLLVSISEFAKDTQDVVKDLDMNPVLVLPEGRGVKVVDALIVPVKGAGA